MDADEEYAISLALELNGDHNNYIDDFDMSKYINQDNVFESTSLLDNETHAYIDEDNETRAYIDEDNEIDSNLLINDKISLIDQQEDLDNITSLSEVELCNIICNKLKYMKCGNNGTIHPLALRSELKSRELSANIGEGSYMSNLILLNNDISDE